MRVTRLKSSGRDIGRLTDDQRKLASRRIQRAAAITPRFEANRLRVRLESFGPGQVHLVLQCFEAITRLSKT